MLSGLLARGYQNTCFAGPVRVKITLSPSLFFYQLTVVQQKLEYIVGVEVEGKYCVLC